MQCFEASTKGPQAGNTAAKPTTENADSSLRPISRGRESSSRTSSRSRPGLFRKSLKKLEGWALTPKQQSDYAAEMCLAVQHRNPTRLQSLIDQGAPVNVTA